MLASSDAVDAPACLPQIKPLKDAATAPGDAYAQGSRTEKRGTPTLAGCRRVVG